MICAKRRARVTIRGVAIAHRGGGRGGGLAAIISVWRQPIRCAGADSGSSGDLSAGVGGIGGSGAARGYTRSHAGPAWGMIQ